MRTVFCFFDSLFEGSERDTELRCFFLLFEMNKYYYYYYHRLLLILGGFFLVDGLNHLFQGFDGVW